MCGGGGDKIILSLLTKLYLERVFYAKSSFCPVFYAGTDIDFMTARMEGSPIISPIKIQLAGNSFSVPQKCVNGYWNLGTRVWLSVNPTADCGMEEPAPSFQLKVRDNGKSIQGKVFINHMGTKSTQNISCDLG